MDVTNMKDRAAGLESTVYFVNGQLTEQDRKTIRAMIVKGGTDEQIREAITISAVNTRIPDEDKTRYAFGVLRNLMLEVEPKTEADA